MNPWRSRRHHRPGRAPSDTCRWSLVAGLVLQKLAAAWTPWPPCEAEKQLWLELVEEVAAPCLGTTAACADAEGAHGAGIVKLHIWECATLFFLLIRKDVLNRLWYRWRSCTIKKTQILGQKGHILKKRVKDEFRRKNIKLFKIYFKISQWKSFNTSKKINCWNKINSHHIHCIFIII